MKLKYKEKERYLNFELMRIISIILIIAHHYSVHGNFNILPGIRANKLYIQFLSMGGKLGVNLFILISGYFLINSSISLKKILKIIIQTYVYSLGIMLIVYFFNLVKMSKAEIMISIFPIVYYNYWFITIFIILYSIVPFLNKIEKSLQKKEYIYFLLIYTILLMMLPSESNLFNINWFAYMYLIGGYINNNKNKELFLKNKWVYMIIFLIFYCLLFLVILIFDNLGVKHNFFYSNEIFFIRMNSPFIYICSISLFLFFKNFKINKSNIIKIISPTVLGIYLIHDNIFVRTLLWDKIYKNKMFYNSNFLYFHSVITISSIFFICFIIEYLRMKITNIIIKKIKNYYYKKSGNSKKI